MNRNIGKNLIRSIVLVLLVVAIGSCTVMVSTPSYIRISNVSNTFTLGHIYITPHNSSVWGSDLLSPNVLLSGESITFQVDAGQYDVMVTDTTPYDAYAYDVAVASGATVILYFDGVNLAP